SRAAGVLPAGRRAGTRDRVAVRRRAGSADSRRPASVQAADGGTRDCVVRGTWIVAPGAAVRAPGRNQSDCGGAAMKATCWMGKRHVEVDEVPDPKILNPRDAIVRIT